MVQSVSKKSSGRRTRESLLLCKISIGHRTTPTINHAAYVSSLANIAVERFFTVKEQLEHPKEYINWLKIAITVRAMTGRRFIPRPLSSCSFDVKTRGRSFLGKNSPARYIVPPRDVLLGYKKWFISPATVFEFYPPLMALFTVAAPRTQDTVPINFFHANSSIFISRWNEGSSSAYYYTIKKSVQTSSNYRNTTLIPS